MQRVWNLYYYIYYMSNVIHIVCCLHSLNSRMPNQAVLFHVKVFVLARLVKIIAKSTYHCPRRCLSFRHVQASKTGNDIAMGQ